MSLSESVFPKSSNQKLITYSTGHYMVTRSQGARDWVSSIALLMCGKFFKFVKAILTLCKTLCIICYFYNSFRFFWGGGGGEGWGDCTHVWCSLVTVWWRSSSSSSSSLFKNTVNTSGINNLILSYSLIRSYVYRLIFYNLKYC